MRLIKGFIDISQCKDLDLLSREVNRYLEKSFNKYEIKQISFITNREEDNEEDSQSK